MIPSDELRRLMQEQPDFSLAITEFIGLRRRRIERREEPAVPLKPRETRPSVVGSG